MLKLMIKLLLLAHFYQKNKERNKKEEEVRVKAAPEAQCWKREVPFDFMSAKKNKRTHLDCSNVETNIKPATSNEQFKSLSRWFTK